MLNSHELLRERKPSGALRQLAAVCEELDGEAYEERDGRDVCALGEPDPARDPGREMGEPIGPGADRGYQADPLARAGALDRLKEVTGQQAPAGERGGPVRLRL